LRIAEAIAFQLEQDLFTGNLDLKLFARFLDARLASRLKRRKTAEGNLARRAGCIIRIKHSIRQANVTDHRQVLILHQSPFLNGSNQSETRSGFLCICLSQCLYWLRQSTRAESGGSVWS